MTRYVNPVPQYFDCNGDPVVNGKLYYYESGQNILKSTYADLLETIPNTNPVLLDSAGRMPNVFYSGSARVVLKDCNNRQVWERDPVGGENVFSDFGEWKDFVIYDLNDITEHNGNFYLSNTNGNQGNDPSVTPGSNVNWTLIKFLELYNSESTYSEGDIAFTVDGKIWASQLDSNINNNPSSDDGTNWLPAVGEKASILHAGGGDLVAGFDNVLTDTETYYVPLSTSVNINQFIDITLPETYKSQVPVIEFLGGETLTTSTGTETSIIFDADSLTPIRLYAKAGGWRI